MIYLFWFCTFLTIMIYSVGVFSPKELVTARKDSTVGCLFATISIVCLFGGLMTSQWAGFLVLLIVNVIFGKITSAIGTQYPKTIPITIRIASFYNIIVLTFLMMNYFQLHIDITSVLFNFFFM